MESGSACGFVSVWYPMSEFRLDQSPVVKPLKITWQHMAGNYTPRSVLVSWQWVLKRYKWCSVYTTILSLKSQYWKKKNLVYFDVKYNIESGIKPLLMSTHLMSILPELLSLPDCAAMLLKRCSTWRKGKRCLQTWCRSSWWNFGVMPGLPWSFQKRATAVYDPSSNLAGTTT